MWWNKKPKQQPLIWLNKHDGITLHQACSGVLIMGATGSGKTSGAGDMLARALLNEGAGFCVLTAKPDEYARWERLCKDTGREIVRIGPNSPLRCDVLNYEMSLPEASVESAAQLLDTLLQVANRKGAGQGDEQFWMLFLQKIMRWMITLVWLAKRECSISDLYRVITSAPNSTEEAASPEWRKSSYCAECLIEAVGREATQELGLCVAFWSEEWPRLSEKTRSIGYTMATNILEKFLTGPVADISSSGVTNFTPEHIMGGAVCVLDMPYLKWRDPARFFQILFKTLVQRAVLRRHNPLRPVVIWQDEAQLFLTEQDIEVQAVARQSLMVNVMLTQSLPVLYEALGGGQRAEQQAQALIGNLQTKFLCQQSDKVTNEYFSELLGYSKHLFMNGGMHAQEYDFVSDKLGMSQQQASTGFSEQWHADVPPSQFTNLRTGGKENGYFVEAIVTQGGRLFSSGKTWIHSYFKQVQHATRRN